MRNPSPASLRDYGGTVSRKDAVDLGTVCTAARFGVEDEFFALWHFARRNYARYRQVATTVRRERRRTERRG